MATIEPDLATADPTTDPGEAYRVLIARVGRKSPAIPPPLLVRHVMDRVPAGEWSVRLEAMDALLRRLDSARRDGVGVDARPDAGRLLGTYATRRRDADARPYQTILASVDPIAGACDCPDFLKNSLGTCKHLLSLVDHVHAKPKLLRQALKEVAEGLGPGRPSLAWEPVRPLTGEGDWLDRVSFKSDPDANPRRSAREHDAVARLRRGPGDALVPRRADLTDPGRRLGLVDDLIRLQAIDLRSGRADPALKALLLGERDRLRATARRSLSPAEVRDGIKGLKRPLYPYQREGVERFLAGGRLLLADDMGLGKTAQAIAATEILWRSKRIRRGLIIAPASLKAQWAREWGTFSDLPIRVVDGSPAEREATYAACRSGLLIINYEQLLRDEAAVHAWSPDLVVLDEAQRIKNWATKTALAVKALAPGYRLVLTGTPMENRIDELASVVEWVDEMAMEPKWRLGAVHAVRADGRHEVVGVRHLDTLRTRLRGCMLRRIRKDVLSQLPPRTDVRVPIELTEPQREEHDALVQPIAQIVQRSKTRPLTQAEFLRLMSLLTTQRILSNGLAQAHFDDVWPTIRSGRPEESVLRGLFSPKLIEFRQLVRQLVLDQGRKVVVFSQWRRMLALAHWATADLLAGAGLHSGFFTGAEGQRRRTRNIVEFHDDPTFRVLFASDAGGVGLNLQHAANAAINLELPWNPAVLEQRIGRIYRLGQSRPIDVFNLVCEQGIESRIAGLVGSKQAFFKGLFDGEGDAVRFEESGSFLDRVEKLIDPSVLAGRSGVGVDPDAPIDLPDDDDTDVLDEVSDPFERALDEADEAVVEPPTDPAATVVEPEPIAVAEERPGPTGAGPADVRRLLASVQIRRRDDGGISLDAPPEAAMTLAALFEGMAGLLQSMSDPPTGRPPDAEGPASPAATRTG